MIGAINDMKTLIQDLPDDMIVVGYMGGNGDLYKVDHWIYSEETISEEEKEKDFPNGIRLTLVLDIDNGAIDWKH